MAAIIITLVIITAIDIIRTMIKIKNNITVKPPKRTFFSEVEIAAKSIGYWENRSLTSPPEESILCVKGLLAAQRRLIALTGDYVPEEAKTVLDKRVLNNTSQIETPPESLPDGVVSLDLARENKWDQL